MRFILLMVPCLLFSCASSYKPLQPNYSLYSNTTKLEGIDFSYRLGVLREKGNKKYAKREDRKAIRLASVKITNNTPSAFVIGQDVGFYTGNSEFILLDPKTLHKELKQGVPEYLLYLLLTPMQFHSGDDSTPIGLVIGPGLALGNMLGAGGANQNFLKELNTFNVINKTVEPGQTVYGIIGVRDNGFNPITIKFRNAIN
jgi:hypothetical protein